MARRPPLLPLSAFTREAGAILAVALALGAIILWMWVSTPAGPATHIGARILKLTLDLSQERVPTYAVIDLALTDGRRLTLRVPFELVAGCNVGDSVRLIEHATMAGVQSLSVDPAACRNQAVR